MVEINEDKKSGETKMIFLFEWKHNHETDNMCLELRKENNSRKKERRKERKKEQEMDNESVRFFTFIAAILSLLAKNKHSDS